MPNEDVLAQFSDNTIRQLAALQVELARSPKTRIPHLLNVKKYDPKYTLPVDVQMAGLEARINQKDAARETAERTREVNDRLQRQRAGLIDGTTWAGHKFTEEDAAEIEKLMEKYGIVDHEAGAKLYAADLKPQGRPGVATPSATWEFPTFEGLMDNPQKAALNEAYRVVDELRGRAA